jgi:hypothetical protein
MRLAGVEATRDRISWSDVEPASAETDWKQYARAADVLKEYGIPDSGCWHDAPEWTRPIQKLPSNLVATFAFARSAAEAFRGTMDSWEFWNEPDIHPAPEPVWEYAAAQKAASLGFLAAGGEAIIQSSALTSGGSGYSRAAFESELAKYVDVYNFHCYEELDRHPRLHERWHRFLTENGLEEMEIRITECNEPFVARPPEDPEPGVPGVRRFSAEQERVQAEILPKVMLSHMCGGVGRAYWFVFPPWNFSSADWGLMHRDGTVKPAFAAFATMTAVLSPLEMLGEVRFGNSVKGYLFRGPDGRRTLAFWSISEADAGKPVPSGFDLIRQEFVLDAEDGDYRVIDLCGRGSVVRAMSGKLRLVATRYPAYACGLPNDIPIVRRARKPGVPKRYESTSVEDLSIILRVELDEQCYRLAESKTLAEIDGDVLRARIHVWNLSDKAKRCILSLDGGKMEGAGVPMDVLPMDERIVDVEVIPEPDADYRATLRFGGSADGRLVSTLAVRTRMTGRMLAEAEIVETDWRDLSRWSRSDNAATGRISWDEEEQAVRMDLEWDGGESGDRWCYPSFRLDSGILGDALMVEFEARNEQPDRTEDDWRFSMAQFREISPDGKRSASSALNPVLSRWEVRRIAVPTGMDIAGAVSFGAGGSPRGQRISLWIRNLKVIRRKKEKQ